MDGMDTNDFYQEVNEEIAERLVEEAMSEINRLSDSIDDGDQVINLVNEAMSKLLKTHRPMDMSDESELLPIMRAAHALGEPHVSEVYSPPRVASLAHRFGMRAGLSLDLTVLDEADGEPWSRQAREATQSQDIVAGSQTQTTHRQPNVQSVLSIARAQQRSHGRVEVEDDD